MTVELTVLIAGFGLAMFMSSVLLFRAMRQQWGFKAMFGNREGLPALTGWGGRVVRAYGNLMDNLLIYGGVVLTAHVAGISNETTVLGAEIFLVSRVIHAVTYIGGVPVIRTFAYVGGAVGIIMIVTQLF